MYTEHQWLFLVVIISVFARGILESASVYQSALGIAKVLWGISPSLEVKVALPGTYGVGYGAAAGVLLLGWGASAEFC